MTECSCVKVQIQPWIWCCSGLPAAHARPQLYQSPPEILLWLTFSHQLISTQELMAISSATLSFAASAKRNRGHCRRPSLKDTVTSRCSPAGGGRKICLRAARLLKTTSPRIFRKPRLGGVFLGWSTCRMWMPASRRKHKDAEPVL